MIDEKELSIEELMNFGTNYGKEIPININELKRLFDTKEDKKTFQTRLDMIKDDFIHEFRLPEVAINSFFNDGTILSYESSSKSKKFYFDYFILIQYVLEYFCNNTTKDEIRNLLDKNTIDEVKDNINKKLKQIRKELKNCTNLEEFMEFANNHNGIYNYAMQKVGKNGRTKVKYAIDEMERQINAVIVNHKYLVEYVQNSTLNEKLFKNINKEKFMFYLAGVTLQECMKRKETDLSIYYAINYYMHKIETGTPNINVTINGSNYSFIVFSRQLREYIKLHKDVDMIRFKKDTFSDCTPEEVKSYLEDFHNNTLNDFDIVETDDVYIPGGVDTGIKREKTKRGRKATKPQEISKLTLQKRRFYKENKEQIYATLMGKNKFEGYVAHVLKNGYVIFEKHDKASNMISNKSGAAYIMTIGNFNEFSKKSIPEIRSYVKNNCDGNIDINYICHRGNWMEKLQKIMYKDTGISLSQIERVLLKSSRNKR